jgi:Rrf2 family iron-sulfur cluster assembly transcriptional regulator
MLSQTGLYALQALLHLAAHGTNGPVPSGVMARELGIPANYRAKVLQRLSREGILAATRGARGGYRLVPDPARLTVAKVVAPFQDLGTSKTCLMGGPCDLANPCVAHTRRLQWNATALASLERTTLTDLLTGIPEGPEPPRSPTQPTENDR